jgi:hypothetical protein
MNDTSPYPFLTAVALVWRQVRYIATVPATNGVSTMNLEELSAAILAVSERYASAPGIQRTEEWECSKAELPRGFPHEHPAGRTSARFEPISMGAVARDGLSEDLLRVLQPETSRR